MVTMICDGKGTVLHSQWVSALFGYALGWMAAVESYRAGRDLAVGIHRRTNPDLQREADTGKGLVINRDLPDVERRYLHDLLENDSQGDLSQLQRWKETSHDDRNGRKQEELFAIERAILVDNETPGKSLMELADVAGWDVTALKNWKNAQVSEKEASDANELCNANELSLNLLLYLVATGLLVWGAISVTGSVRTYCIATLLAPFGTILRWRLSRLNGSITNPRWEWFPIGTYTANMLASTLSCLLAALSVGTESQLALTFLNAISSGFAGSLSTVSTFVVEIVELLRSLPQHARGYYYLMGSLVSALILGVICNLWAVV
jgi:fluoride ion exporter CrcB/FEX